MGQSPSKQLLNEAVVYLEEKVTDIEGQAEDYVQKKVHEVKTDTFEKAKAILQDQKSQWQRTAYDYEERARDECEAQVAQSRATVIGEAWDASN